jgi:hypothetical protein
MKAADQEHGVHQQGARPVEPPCERLDRSEPIPLGGQGGEPGLSFGAAAGVQRGGDAAHGAAAAVDLLHAPRDAERA